MSSEPHPLAPSPLRREGEQENSLQPEKSTSLAVGPRGKVHPLNVLRAVLIALVVGWAVALAAGYWLARLEYTEISHTFAADQVNAAYEDRVVRELQQGPLLLLAQAGALAGALAWDVGRQSRHMMHPVRFGVLCGLVLAVIQGAIAFEMHVPWTFIIPMAGMLVGVGVYAGWSEGKSDAGHSTPSQ